jgi:hypothetical protein
MVHLLGYFMTIDKETSILSKIYGLENRILKLFILLQT